MDLPLTPMAPGHRFKYVAATLLAPVAALLLPMAFVRKRTAEAVYAANRCSGVNVRRGFLRQSRPRPSNASLGLMSIYPQMDI
jgi:hypothetical protein